MTDTALPGTFRNFNSVNFTGNAGNFFNQNTRSDPDCTRTTTFNNSQNSRRGPKYPQYSITCIRLSTFQTWPTSIQQHPETMAEAGFYYTGNNDHVRCFHCGIGLQNWDSEDNPFIEHARWCAECQFLKDKKGLDFIATVQDGDRRVQMDKTMDKSQNSRKGPKYPEYSITRIRLSTFQTWPTSIQQHPGIMAEAGFYYTGEEDTVVCFHCGTRLQNWDSEDNPFVEHARWSAKCQYLKDTKGLDFIAAVQSDVKREKLRNRKTRSLGINLVEDSTTHCIPLYSNSVSKEDGYSRSEDRFRDFLPSGKPPTKAEIQNPLWTDAAQSILTMGYLPKVIKIVVDRVLKEKGWIGMSVRNLMVEIKKIEEYGDIPKLTIPVSSRKHISKDDVKKIEDENKEMEDQMICKICCEMPLSTVFLPCGHLLSCSQCTGALTACPVCRSEVKGSVEVQFKK